MSHLACFSSSPCRALAGAVFVLTVLAACGSDRSTAPNETSNTNLVTPDRAAAPNIPVDAQGCMDLAAHRPRPIRPTGKLVVTYVDPVLEAQMCDFDDESKQWWCPSTSMGPECANVADVIWCPVANPPPERTGDPQELASFDLANPGAGVRRWTNNFVHEAELDISPDGRRVVYAVRKKMDGFENGLGLWVSNSDGTNPRKVVDRTDWTGIPTWIPPSNEKFSYLSDDGLHVFDMATNRSTLVRVDGLDPGLIIDPEASYDGRRMTFKANRTAANFPSIWVMDFDGTRGSNVKQLTRGPSDHDPVFSRDNRKIYFERYYGPGEWDQDLDRLEHPEINQWGIVEVDPATSAERVLIPHDKCGKHFFWLPTVSPDGRYLMFIHDYVAEDGYQDLWISDIDGKDAQPVAGTRRFHWFDWTN